MYGYTKQWEDGHLKWLQKSNVKPEHHGEFDYSGFITVTLISCDIMSDDPGITWKIEHAGVILKQFTVSGVTSWYVDNNIITVFSHDYMPVKLLFMTASEANKADYRLYLIMNGAVVVDCNDDIYYKCKEPIHAKLSYL